jgi:L-threonylcarbamoyladenylate synthase
MKNNSISEAAQIINTSQTCNKIEISTNSLASLHAMEEDKSVKSIYIDPVEEIGLGIAIMDRVKKAAYQYNKPTN